MDFINKSIDEIEAELFLRSRQYDTQIKQIATIPGITELSALFILSEVGADDISVFESERGKCAQNSAYRFAQSPSKVEIIVDCMV